MGFAKAEAAIQQGMVPRVTDMYGNAATADAGYAKGLSGPVQQNIDENVAHNNQFLHQTGAPDSALTKSPDVGGTAYGLQGYIPASGLQREGAAFGAAAGMLPADTLNMGQQNAFSALENTKNIAGLREELAKVAATYPTVYQHLVALAQAQQYHQAELGLSRQRLGIEAFRANTSARQGQERIGISRQDLALRSQYENASLSFRQAGLALARQKEADAVQKAIVKGRMPDATLSKVYGYVVDGNGRPILKGGHKIKVIKSSSKSSGLAPWATPKPKGGKGAVGSPLPTATGQVNAGGFLPAGTGYTYDRHDQGRDIQTRPGAPIIAPGAGYVVRIGSDPGGGGGHFGPRYPIVHFTSGPYAGQDVYIGHTVAAVRPGQRFRAGAVLSHTQTSGPMNGGAPSGWAEIGFAPGGTPGSFNQPAPF